MSRLDIIKVTVDEADTYTLYVEPAPAYYPADFVEAVDISPRYGWPTHAEIHDAVAEAVKVVMDRMQGFDSGEPVRRG